MLKKKTKIQLLSRIYRSFHQTRKADDQYLEWPIILGHLWKHGWRNCTRSNMQRIRRNMRWWATCTVISCLHSSIRDIINLAGELDTTIDTIEDKLIRIDILSRSKITQNAEIYGHHQAHWVLTKRINDLKNFKKSKVIKDAIIAINRLEKREIPCILVRSKSVVEQKDALATITTTNIWSRFERATDSFEAAANVIETINPEKIHNIF